MRKVKLESAIFFTVVCSVGLSAKATDRGIPSVLTLMPGDNWLSAIIMNAEAFDSAAAAFMRNVGDDYDVGTIVPLLKSSVALGEWVDFARPIGIAARDVESDQRPLFWVVVPEFADKVKTWPGARKENGVWRLPIEEADAQYAMLLDEYVVVGGSQASLAGATPKANSLAEAIGTRRTLLTGRQVYVHVHLEAVREAFLGGIRQMAQMGPMLALAMAQQGGQADPATATRLVDALFGAVTQFAEQLAYADLAIGMDAETANVTVATGYEPGSISQYLSRQKPANVRPFSQIEEQSYAVAASYHCPGTESPFWNYLLESMIKVTARATTGETPGPAGTSAAGTGSPSDTGMSAHLKQVYAKVEGAEAVMSLTKDGMSAEGRYISRDPTGLMDLLQRVLSNDDPLLARLKGGTGFEPAGMRKIGKASVYDYVMKIDATNPIAGVTKSIYGDELRFGVGDVGDGIRFYVGDKELAKRVFATNTVNPLGSAKEVQGVLDALPKVRNAVVLVDLGELATFMAPMMGRRMTDPVAVGPPIGVSASFAGEPARIDIHVPVRAIRRVVRAMSPVIVPDAAASDPAGH
ncbi:MAG: hypothetical protein JSU63_01750 [Phycisphaerales bacterium]|nr:MAG: hypothetical protein JSU63_01750 [Phycisphaerales bacterium]